MLTAGCIVLCSVDAAAQSQAERGATVWANAAVPVWLPAQLRSASGVTCPRPHRRRRRLVCLSVCLCISLSLCVCLLSISLTVWANASVPVWLTAQLRSASGVTCPCPHRRWCQLVCLRLSVYSPLSAMWSVRTVLHLEDCSQPQRHFKVKSL